MAERSPFWQIEDFSLGQNNFADPRRLMPLNVGDAAEGQLVQNFDIIEQGALFVSPGFEQISDTGEDGKCFVATLNSSSANRFLIAVAGGKFFNVNTVTGISTEIDAGHRWATPSGITHINAVQFRGTTSRDYLIFVDDVATHVPKKIRYDGANLVIADMAASPPGNNTGYIIEEMMGFLFIAQDRTLYYSQSQDETAWGAPGGTIGFNNRLVGLKKTSDKKLKVLMSDGQSQEVSFLFDDTALTYTPKKDEFMLGIGGLAHKTTQHVLNDTYFLQEEGVSYFGQNPAYNSSGLRANTLSFKIDNSIQQVNYDKAEIACAGYLKKKYTLSLPVGRGTTYNNETFQYFTEHDAWVYKPGIQAYSYTVYREDDQREMYFGSATDGIVYKFNNSFNYGGNNYTSRWVSKTFNYGTSVITKRVPYIEVAGSKPLGAQFQVIVSSDGVTETYLVDDTALVVNGSGGYIGDSYLGDEFFGGNFTSVYGQFYRFFQRIPLSQRVIEGREFTYEFKREGQGSPFKIDFFNSKYELSTEAKVKDRHINTNVISAG